MSLVAVVEEVGKNKYEYRVYLRIGTSLHPWWKEAGPKPPCGKQKMLEELVKLRLAGHIQEFVVPDQLRNGV